MDLLTEDELYELQYGDDLDALNEMDSTQDIAFEGCQQAVPPSGEEIEVIHESSYDKASSSKSSFTSGSSIKQSRRLFSEVEVNVGSSSYTIDDAIEIHRPPNSPTDKITRVAVIPNKLRKNVGSANTCKTDSIYARKSQKRAYLEDPDIIEVDTSSTKNKKSQRRAYLEDADIIEVDSSSTKNKKCQKRLFLEDENIIRVDTSSTNSKKFQKRLFLEDADIIEVDTDNNVSKRQKISSKNSVARKEYLSFSTNLLKSTSQGGKYERLPVTKSDGSKSYFRISEEEEEETGMFSFAKNTSCLLTVPISALKDKINLQLEEKLAYEKSQEHNAPVEIQDEGVSEIPRVDDELWVEKYRPRSYLDLLSDEGINRALLFWLKLWDKVVFGRERRKPSKDKPKPQPQPQQPQQQQKKFQKTFKELTEEPDEHGRPYYKVAFLCGPPGLGKTTLAHIIGIHAGYNVVEFNASDDRNPETFRVNLESATQMKSVLDQNPRPNCLIIDEIDGAPAPSINVLLSFVKSIGSVKGKRRKGDLPILMRPIICICNDQYASALKPLKQLAFVLNFAPPATRRLASRLLEIALSQCLKADMSALILLCEKADNDVRSCLSTLQFIYRQKKSLSISDVTGMEIGLKDVQKSLFSVWNQVFHFSKEKSSLPRTAHDNIMMEKFMKNDSSLKSRFYKLLQTVQTCAEYEKLINGLFENYLNINFRDTQLEKLWQGPEWLCFADLIQKSIAENQVYTLMPYFPYIPVAFHMLYATTSYPKISYPFSLYECNVKQTQFTNVLATVLTDVVISIKRFMNFSLLVLDILPVLVELLKPSLRQVNTQLYSGREKSELQRVIEIMIAFNLNYRQERSIEGQYSYVLDPNVEEIVHYTCLKAKRILTYSTKQLISREVELEKLRRNEVITKGSIKEGPKKYFSQSKKAENDSSTKIKRILPERPNLDFFGRKIEEKIVEITEGDKVNADQNDIWFRFKEGYSNAVRKTVWIQDLL